VAKVRATKAPQKLNFNKADGKRDTVIETKKKHADKPIPVPWYGQKKDSKRSF
jgi:hypothetical protein